MKRTSAPLFVSVSVTLLALGVALLAYSALLTEEHAFERVIASLPQGTSHYTLLDKQHPEKCGGVLTVTFEGATTQLNAKLTGWVILSSGDRSIAFEMEGMSAFNALGQMSASFIRATAGNQQVRLGLVEVNPIHLKLFNSADNSGPLFSQQIPGPIILRPQGTRYELLAPSLGQSSLVIDRTLTSLLPFTIEPVASADSCIHDPSNAIDISQLIASASSLSERLRGVLPGI